MKIADYNYHPIVPPPSVQYTELYVTGAKLRDLDFSLPGDQSPFILKDLVENNDFSRLWNDILSARILRVCDTKEANRTIPVFNENVDNNGRIDFKFSMNPIVKVSKERDHDYIYISMCFVAKNAPMASLDIIIRNLDDTAMTSFDAAFIQGRMAVFASVNQ